MAKPTQIYSGFHAYGYWVCALDKKGTEVTRETYGNSSRQHDAVELFSTGQPICIERLQEAATMTAACMAEQYRVSKDNITVFHDVNTENMLREQFADYAELTE